jgi:hypothetical protein
MARTLYIDSARESTRVRGDVLQSDARDSSTVCMLKYSTMTKSRSNFNCSPSSYAQFFSTNELIQGSARVRLSPDGSIACLWAFEKQKAILSLSWRVTDGLRSNVFLFVHNSRVSVNKTHLCFTKHLKRI